MTAAKIATALGLSCRSGRWWRCRCPVHDSRGPTLALCDGDQGLIAVCHAGCSRDAILAELTRRGLIPGRSDGARRSPKRHSDDVTDTARRITLARRIWGMAKDARGSPVVRYLASRGITIPLPPSLRWTGSLRRPDGTYAPAMVARVDSLAAELIGVHRTYLTSDWRRGARASLGPIAVGAVRLAPPAEMLMIGEGIETCLAAMQATRQPAWAALSASGVAALELPLCVRELVILADHDRSGTGQTAAHTAARRWLREGRRVRIAMPPEPGADFNDMLLAGAEVCRDAA